MRWRMRRTGSFRGWVPAVAGLAFLLCAGCGDDERRAPHLTGVRTDADRFYTWVRPTLYELRGEVDFYDADGDVIELRAWKRDCGVGDGVYLEWSLTNLTGVAHGAIPFVIPFSTECPAGQYAAHLYVIDQGGLPSNEVAVPFRICDNILCN